MRMVPKDPDSRVLELMQEYNADFSKEHEIEFFLYFKDIDAANLAKIRLEKMDFDVEICKNENSSTWLCLAFKRMLAEHSQLNRIRKRLEKLALRLNGEYDGWGTLIK